MFAKAKAAVGALLISAVCAQAQTVTVSLTSPQNAATVEPGVAITWSIAFTTSTGDNAGLALLVTDLIQDPNNPELIDIPAASGVPGAMTNFSRPDGISNPGDGNDPTGYVGVQRGTLGSQVLRQIGGAQNGFGQAMMMGSGVAENANVVAGVGQSGSVTLASGTFNAPSTEGDYTYSLDNVIANVFSAVNSVPTASPAVSANVSVAAGSISFTVSGATPCFGDLDNSGTRDLSDLAGLLAAFGTSMGDAGFNPAADLDNSGMVDLADLAGLLSVFGVPCP
ncbi:MAG: hypothetical protein KDA32_03880 [Phycisphaerales bacterium]|nr:hypothetical protein [Phycisphaerales bacterium]